MAFRLCYQIIYQKAQKILIRADFHMQLEDQKVQSDLEFRILKFQL
jgi:hypothetical protein